MSKYLKLLVVFLAVVVLAGCAKKIEGIKKEEKKEETVEDIVKQAKEKCLKSTKVAYAQYVKDFKIDTNKAVCSVIRSTSLGTSTVIFNDKDNHVHSYYIFNSTSSAEEKATRSTSDSSMYDKGECKNEENLSAVSKAKCLLARTARENYDKYVELAGKTPTSKYGEFAFIFNESDFK